MLQLTLDALARTDLVFPLTRHDLGIGTRDLETSIQASLVVSIHNITAKRLSSPVTTVVRSLGCREAVVRPAVDPASLAEHGVFLLETEPGLVLLVRLHDDGGVVAEVVGVGLAVGHVG